MENLVVIFGGESTEHDISIISALQAMENLDKSKYNILPVYVSKSGEWYYGGKLKDIKIYKTDDYKKLKKVCIVPVSQWLYAKTLHGYKKLTKIDCILAVFHGKNGEDGTMQGLFELAKIPYTSSDVLGCSIGMDKIIQKQIFAYNKVPILPFYWFTKSEYLKNKDEILNNTEFDFPKIVKPCNLGSSIGINVCKNIEQLENAIEVALKFDNKVVVEKALTNFKEINISVMQDIDELLVSDIEQPKNWKEFLDFEEKYLASINKSSKTATKKSKIKISKTLLADISGYSKSLYRNLGLKGVVRFDYMIDKDTNRLYLNEINVIPGSLAFYLWENIGIRYSNLLDKMIENAKQEQTKKEKLQTIYISDVLSKSGNSIGKLRK